VAHVSVTLFRSKDGPSLANLVLSTSQKECRFRIISQTIFNFDQDYIKNYIYLWYKINIIIFIMRSIFTIYLFNVISIDIFL
jgi:hypothetical protein